MANVLGELFQGIADAIRGKTGDTAKLSPNGFAAAIEAIVVGSGDSSGGGAASDDVRYVTFMNGNTVLYKKAVATGDDCVDVLAKGLIETPTKESDDQYDYTYCGWGASDGGAADDTILQNITEDKTVYAVYEAHQYLMSGECGENALWQFNKNTGVLTISGEGDMENYDAGGDQPWYEYMNDIQSLVVEEGITRVGARTVLNAVNLSSVDLPEGILSIERSAFNGCSSLTGIVIPDSVTTICFMAFQKCTALTSVVIPDNVKTLETQAFCYCYALSELVIGSSVESIGPNQFRDAALTSVIIPDSVKTLEVSVFIDCVSLTSVEIGSGVTKIAPAAFQGTALTSAKFKETGGWWYAVSSSATSGTALSSSDMEDPAIAATYLSKTYQNYYLYRS